MSHFEDIYEIAADNYGIVTAAQAKERGIVGTELNRYVADGRIVKLGHGLYKITRYIPTAYDAYAEAVAHVGDGAYLYGDAVLAMHGLAFANPAQIKVATRRRVRKELPAWVRLVKPEDDDLVVLDEGIPAQSIPDAILSCKGTIMRERLVAAVREARRQGLLTANEYVLLRGEFDELEACKEE